MNKKYFKLRLKQNLKYYPTIFFVTLLTMISIVVACGALLLSNATSEKQQKITIGIVGNMEDTYFDIGLNVLKDADTSNFYIEWVEMDSEDEAKKALENRTINGYIRIPENYIKNIFYGKNNPARYVMLNAPEGFGTIISSEVADIISDVVVESQVGMYSMQNIAKKYHPQNRKENVSILMQKYMDHILSRNEIYEIKSLGILDELSFSGYYACSLLLIFMLLWGISCNNLFSSNNTEFSKILNNAGLKPHQQIRADFKAYLVITLITLAVFGVIFGISMQFFDIRIPELSGLRIIDVFGYLIMILPVIIMISMMQCAIYELIPNKIAAILTQFVLTVLLGYISGCFYPTYFFPEIAQKISAILPIGAGFSYMRKAMTGLPSFTDFVLVSGYAAAFFAVAYYSKKYKITGDVR